MLETTPSTSNSLALNIVKKEPDDVEVAREQEKVKAVNTCHIKTKTSDLFDWDFIMKQGDDQIAAFNGIYKKNTNLLTTMLLSSQSETFYCKNCSFSTSMAKELEEHKVNPKELCPDVTYKCDICSYRPRSKHDLKQHKKLHISTLRVRVKSRLKKQEKKQLKSSIQCAFGDYQNANLVNIKRHLNNINSDKVCGVCQNQTNDLNVQEENPDLLGKCKCSINASEATELKEHKINNCVKLGQLTMHKSDTCDSLKQHQIDYDVVHCDSGTCEESTIGDNNLKSDQKLHSNPAQVEYFGCGNCNYRTKYETVLKRHQMRHLNLDVSKSDKDLTYTCDLCI